MKRLSIFLVICLLSVSLFSQNTPSSSSTVSNIQAQILDPEKLDSITITWSLPSSSLIKNIRLYRSNSQILTLNLSQLQPVIILSAKDTKYVDTVPDIEKDYYYALMCELSDSVVFELVIPSVNATVTAVTPMPLQSKLSGLVQPNNPASSRNERSLIPLPYLNITENSADLQNSISSESQSLAGQFGSKSLIYSIKPVYVFPEDEKPLSGEQYLLSTIINSSFIQNDWTQAEKELDSFLSINRSREITKRAIFYKAQVLYYQTRFPESLPLFMDVEDEFPDLTREWVESVLLLYEIPKN